MSAVLPWNDVNLLIVTDVHSWVAGHAHPDHTPLLDADYGHVLSLYEHLSAAAAASGRDGRRRRQPDEPASESGRDGPAAWSDRLLAIRERPGVEPNQA